MTEVNPIFYRKGVEIVKRGISVIRPQVYRAFTFLSILSPTSLKDKGCIQSLGMSGLLSSVHEVSRVVSCVHEASGCVHEASGCVHEASGCVHEVSGCIHEVSGCVHEASGCVHEASGVLSCICIPRSSGVLSCVHKGSGVLSTI